MKTLVLLISLVAILAITTLSPLTPDISRVKASPASPPEQVTAVPLYRFDQLFGSLYTTDEDEKEVYQHQPSWHFQGITGYVFPKQVPGTVPFYRLVKNDATGHHHFYTIDKSYADNLVKNLGWVSEGIACYLAQSKVSGTVPLYYLYNPQFQHHLYTADGQEKYRQTLSYGYQLAPMIMYIWTKPTTLDMANGANPNLPPDVKEQLFNLGCEHTPGKPNEISCPTQWGYEICESGRKKGQLKVTACHTTVDQAAFTKIETDLSGRACTRFLGRPGEYLCLTLNGAQACNDYLKRGDGLVTKCLSVKQAEMDKDLTKRGCKRVPNKPDEYLCAAGDSFKACENYRLDGQVKLCHLEKK